MWRAFFVVLNGSGVEQDVAMKMKPKNAAGDSDEYNKLSDVMDMQYSCGDFYFML